MGWEREMDEAIGSHAERCPVLFAGDVILTRSNTLLGKLIRLAERRPGDPARYNHVGLVTRSGLVSNYDCDPIDYPGNVQAEMTEALWHVRRGPVWDFYGPPAGKNRPEIAVYRPYTLPSNVRSAVAARAEVWVGHRYGWWKLFTHLGDSALSALVPGVGDVRLLRRLNFVDSRPICSYLVADAFSSRGLDFGVPPGSASPDDIEDFCRTNTDKYRLVFEGKVA